MTRPYNFSAGPAMLPEAVLQQIKDELFDWHQGMSVMEMSHRSKEFMALIETCESDLRSLLKIPDNYKVMFMQGGATGQFSAIPMNIIGETGKADYVETGIWSKKATSLAKPYGDIKVVASSEDNRFTNIPDFSNWTTRSDASYLHYAPNETINGVEFHWVPQVDVPLVADMSSCILSRPIEVTDYALIYAGAQKNMGPAGITLVIAREDLIGKANPLTPAVLDYANFAGDDHSIYNTPPTFAWYVCALMYKWVINQGGLDAMRDINAQKADMLYDFIDNSDFYANPVQKDCRSRMNVPFTLADDALDKTFLAEAEKVGLYQLKGHRLVGGMRASIYNAMPIEGVKALIDFMIEFERVHA